MRVIHSSGRFSPLLLLSSSLSELTRAALVLCAQALKCDCLVENIIRLIDLPSVPNT